jgi:hypothetical protein
MMRSWSWVVDRIEYAAMSVKFAILDWIYGPEPPTSADRQREADKGRLQRAFPAIGLDRKGNRAIHA